MLATVATRFGVFVEIKRVGGWRPSLTPTVQWHRKKVSRVLWRLHPGPTIWFGDGA